MTSTTTALIMAIALPLLGFSQNENSIESKPRVTFSEVRPTQNIETSISISEIDPIQIAMVSSNAVSSSTTVHTYKYFGQDDVNVEYQDSDPRESTSARTDLINEKFLTVEGVTECTFDQATQTFTIVSGPQTDLTQIVNDINKK